MQLQNTICCYFRSEFYPFKIYFIGSMCEVQLKHNSYGFKGVVITIIGLKTVWVNYILNHIVWSGFKLNPTLVEVSN